MNPEKKLQLYKTLQRENTRSLDTYVPNEYFPNSQQGQGRKATMEYLYHSVQNDPGLTIKELTTQKSHPNEVQHQQPPQKRGV